MVVVGVDGFSRGWTAVLLEDGRFSGAAEFPDFSALLARLGQAEVVAVDIPIGLPASGRRDADTQAKKFVGRRRSSVFPTPPRRVIEAPSYQEALALSVDLTGGGISSQTYALRNKILEVDQVVRTSSSTIIEIHPEVSFRALAGHELQHPKSTWNGLMLRRRLLAEAGIHLPEVLEEVRVSRPDDVLDAAAAAWSATRFARGISARLPNDDQLDEHGRPMAIWY